MDVHIQVVREESTHSLHGKALDGGKTTPGMTNLLCNIRRQRGQESVIKKQENTGSRTEGWAWDPVGLTELCDVGASQHLSWPQRSHLENGLECELVLVSFISFIHSFAHSFIHQVYVEPQMWSTTSGGREDQWAKKTNVPNAMYIPDSEKSVFQTRGCEIHLAVPNEHFKKNKWNSVRYQSTSQRVKVSSVFTEFFGYWYLYWWGLWVKTYKVLWM